MYLIYHLFRRTFSAGTVAEKLWETSSFWDEYYILGYKKRVDIAAAPS